MNSQQQYLTSVADLPSLELTLNILLNRQEKDWGCFQVIKEGEFYALYIPTMDSFKLFKNPKSENYRGYWRNYLSETLPDVKNRGEKPDIFLRNRSKQVEEKKKNSNLIIRKKQRIIDVKYRYNPCAEMYRLNQMIAKLIRDRLASNATFDPGTEIMPLVLATEVED
ncbi:hypothetical protein I4641_20290 [Waterburya agarophytonicola K14]|uniref:Uncharacterized protein n=1 Tax=Waterburya agarophytonicola KI4 TaxID=2874699 RepID=A0A964FHN4_9CYAN|nr:hypothetical protein [Waterburya agarophytonicola]MCC0179306.1 hypothetical protein [Waterburya agarophytonicola KI4]